MNSVSTLINTLAVILVAMIGMASAAAHPATERYIPVGQSPGISGQSSYVGAIEGVDEATRTIIMMHEGRRYTVQVTEETRIWVDRSGERKTNLVGGYEDCTAGRKAEIKFVDPDQKTTAEWIKLEAE